MYFDVESILHQIRVFHLSHPSENTNRHIQIRCNIYVKLHFRNYGEKIDEGPNGIRQSLNYDIRHEQMERVSVHRNLSLSTILVFYLTVYTHIQHTTILVFYAINSCFVDGNKLCFSSNSVDEHVKKKNL